MGNNKIFSKVNFAKLKNEFRDNKKMFLWIILFAIFSATTFEIFNRPFGDVITLKIPFDDKIPMIPQLILVYHTFMLMIVLVGWLLLIEDKHEYKKFIVTLFTSQILAYIIYINFQQYIPRYDTNLLGDDIFSNLVKLTYTVDNSYSGAPSLHVCDMTLSILYFIKLKYNKVSKILFSMYLALIALTTVLVKQHVVLDIPAGLLHAFITYIIVEYICNKRRTLK